MNKRILFLIGLALILRLLFLGAESLWLDEGISLYQAHKPIPEMLSEVKEDVHVPGYTLVLHVWLMIFPDSEFSIRLPSVLFGVAAVGLLYIIGRRLFGEKTGFIAGLLLAVSPFAVYYAQEARPYAMLLFFVLLSTLFFLQYLKGKKHAWLYLCLVNAAILYTHIFGALFILMQSIYILYKREWSWRWTGTQALTGILFLPWIPILISQVTHSRNINWIDVLNLYVLGDYVSIFFGSFIFLLAMLATYYFYREFDIFAFIFTLPFFLFIILGFFIPIFHVRYVLFTLPFFYLLFAKQLVKLPKIVYTLMVIFLVILTITQLVTLQKDDWRSTSQDILAFDDTVLVHPYYHQEILSYYIDRDCFYSNDVYGCMVQNYDITSLHDEERSCYADAKISDYYPLGHYTPIMLIDLRSHIYFEENCSDFFNQNYKLVNTSNHGEIMISIYRK